MKDEQQPVQRKKWSNTLKTAAVVLGVNLMLTGFKFAVFWLSGSLAVLAEAWHSFTDIATSGLILLAILISGRRACGPAGGGKETGPPGAVSRQEIGASVCIGLLLLGVSGLVFCKMAASPDIAVRNPLLSGIIFIGFSVASFLVGEFETRMGKSQASLGLISDGMHAKADMFASLLTGFSLILYAMGMNIDRWMAGVIAVIILCLALDTFINAYRVSRDRNGDSLYTYRFLAALLSLFSRQSLKRLPRRFHQLISGRLEDPRKVTLVCRSFLAVPLAVLCVVYGSTAFYTVAVNETAIVERFGKPLHGSAPMGPGLHMKLPWPVDRVIRVASATIEKLNIGNVSVSNTKAFLWTLKHGSEEAFLTGDNNFFYPYIILHYRISDPYQYIYNHSDPRQLLNEIGHQKAVSLFAMETFYDIATTDRAGLQEKMRQVIQTSLDRHRSGMTLVSVNFKDIHPPISIAKSFENVIAGFQKKQEYINQAVGYANSVVPDARGDAESRIQSAGGRSVMRLNRAAGKAKRFELRLPAPGGQRRISMSRIYYETMQEALKDKAKIIVDPDAGTPDVWMDFDYEDLR